MNDLVITTASENHVELVAPLFDAYRQFYGQSADLDAARSFLVGRLARKESVVFLAMRQGEAQGFTQLYPSFSSISMKRLWILNDLYVIPEARGHGVGTALLERARAHAVETCAKGLVLETARNNAAAQRVYERLGWVRDEAYFRYDLLA